ncbi:ANTAR domain-containing protein [Streptomyces sp. NPDC004752]
MPEPPHGAGSISGDDAVCTRTISSSIVTRHDGDHIVVRIDGELCFDDAELLEHTLRAALGKPVSRLNLDLGDLTFWDGSALNVLLNLRRQAIAAGKAIAVTAASPVAERLLSLTDTRSLFTPAHESNDQGRDEDAGDGLRCEVIQLRRALQTRPEIDMARGILMASFGLDPDEAWDVLVMASQCTNTKVHRLASDVVTTVTGTALPEPMRRQLTAAVARRRDGAVRNAHASAPRHDSRPAGPWA